MRRFFMPVVLAGAVLALATASVRAEDLPALWNATPPAGVSPAPSGPVVGVPGEFDTGTLATNDVWDNFSGAAGSDPDGRLWLEDTINQGGTQVYDPARSFLDGNGNAVLEAIRSGDTIQSGRFTSRTKFNMQYGWCAARIKFPKAGRAWFPAFWLLFIGYNTGNPYGEIDMMEFFGDTDTYNTHFHFGSYPSLSSIKPVPASHSGGDAGDGFHTYWMQWEPDRIQIGVDDFIMGEWGPDSVVPASAWDHMRQPFYFIANFAVAPSWLPEPEPSDFPARMEIDWIWYKPLTDSSNQPPVADAGGDITVWDTNLDDAADVTLDGTASHDPDGSIVSHVWAAGSTQVGLGATPTLSLPVGTHTLTLTATDDEGATDSDSVVATVHFQDDDGDGIADTWEIENFDDTSNADETSDADGDNVSDLDEFLVGSDPNDPDSPPPSSGDGDTGVSCSPGGPGGGLAAALLGVLLSLELMRLRRSQCARAKGPLGCW